MRALCCFVSPRWNQNATLSYTEEYTPLSINKARVSKHNQVLQHYKGLAILTQHSTPGSSIDVGPRSALAVYSISDRSSTLLMMR
jgi:hypothetical protein